MKLLTSEARTAPPPEEDGHRRRRRGLTTVAVSALVVVATSAPAVAATAPVLQGQDHLAHAGVVAVVVLAGAVAGIPVVTSRAVAERRRRRPWFSEDE